VEKPGNDNIYFGSGDMCREIPDFIVSFRFADQYIPHGAGVSSTAMGNREYERGRNINPGSQTANEHSLLRTNAKRQSVYWARLNRKIRLEDPICCSRCDHTMRNYVHYLPPYLN
jgi:hypothetical protein